MSRRGGADDLRSGSRLCALAPRTFPRRRTQARMSTIDQQPRGLQCRRNQVSGSSCAGIQQMLPTSSRKLGLAHSTSESRLRRWYVHGWALAMAKRGKADWESSACAVAWERLTTKRVKAWKGLHVINARVRRVQWPMWRCEEQKAQTRGTAATGGTEGVARQG